MLNALLTALSCDGWICLAGRIPSCPLSCLTRLHSPSFFCINHRYPHYYKYFLYSTTKVLITFINTEKISLLMCGIIGYIGHDHGTPVVLAGLKELEYRGYDSWG